MFVIDFIEWRGGFLVVSDSPSSELPNSSTDILLFQSLQPANFTVLVRKSLVFRIVHFFGPIRLLWRRPHGRPSSGA